MQVVPVMVIMTLACIRLGEFAISQERAVQTITWALMLVDSINLIARKDSSLCSSRDDRSSLYLQCSVDNSESLVTTLSMDNLQLCCM